jgi:hypothetical protein
VLFGWAAGLFRRLPRARDHADSREAAAASRRLQRLGRRARGDRRGAVSSPLHGDGAGGVLAGSALPRSAQYTVNLILITAIVAVSARRSLFALARTNVRVTVVPFSLMASAALMLVVLWERSPFLSVALVGPLLAIQLYQRAIVGGAARDAARADRPADGPRQPPALPRAARAELRHAQEKGLRSRSASSTSTTSSGSTTASAIRPATASSRSWPRGSGRPARRSASAATSSRCCCPATTRAARSPPRLVVERIAALELEQSARSPSASASRPRRARRASATS